MREYIPTIVFFDQFDYPLTMQEAKAWQLRSSVVPEQNCTIDSIEQTQSFYHLKGRKKIVMQRKKRYVVAAQKYQKALRFIRFIKYVPFVRMVAVCNTLAYSNAKQASDIDLFIIVEKDRLWLTRLLITIVAHVTGVRRYGWRVADRMCLSFYITTDALNLQEVTLQPLDVYFVFWMAQLVPVLDIENTFSRFITENSWVQEYLQNPQYIIPTADRRVDETKTSKAIRQTAEKLFSGRFGTMCNTVARSIERYLILNHKNSKVWEDSTDVVVNDTMLKFHESDKRTIYLTQWQKKLHQLK